MTHESSAPAPRGRSPRRAALKVDSDQVDFAAAHAARAQLPGQRGQVGPGPSARSSRSSRGRTAGHSAPQPACVTGPRHGVPCATMTHVARGACTRCRRCAGTCGLRREVPRRSPRSAGPCRSDSRAARSRRRRGRRWASRWPGCRCTAGWRTRPTGTRPRRRSCAAPGCRRGRAGADGDQPPGLLADSRIRSVSCGGGDRALDERQVVRAAHGAGRPRGSSAMSAPRPAPAARPRSRAARAGSRRRTRTSRRRASGRSQLGTRIRGRRGRASTGPSRQMSSGPSWQCPQWPDAALHAALERDARSRRPPRRAPAAPAREPHHELRAAHHRDRVRRGRSRRRATASVTKPTAPFQPAAACRRSAPPRRRCGRASARARRGTGAPRARGRRRGPSRRRSARGARAACVMTGRSGARPIPPATTTRSCPAAATGHAVPYGPRTPRGRRAARRRRRGDRADARIVCTTRPSRPDRR